MYDYFLWIIQKEKEVKAGGAAPKENGKSSAVNKKGKVVQRV